MGVFMLAGFAGCDEYPFAGASVDVVSAENDAGGLAEDDKRLRSEAVKNLVDKGCTKQERITNVAQREMSREKLLELAEKARTREEILAERMNLSNI